MKGYIRKRGKSSYEIRIDAGHDERGGRRVVYRNVKGTKRDAERELAAMAHAIETGAHAEPSKLTVKAYLERWRDYMKARVAARTHERYAEIIDDRLIPAIGHHLLGKLRPLDVQGAYTAWMANGRVDGKGGLSARTALHHHRVLREALQHAVRWQLVPRNVADAVDPPRPARVEMRALTEADSAKLLAAAHGSRLYAPIAVALTTGLRRGELLGLRWSDVDLDGATLSVQQTLEQTRSGISFKAPKTAKSRRKIALPSVTVDVLRSHRAEQAKIRLAIGPAYGNRDLVFAKLTGEPMDPHYLTDGVRTLTQGLELPRTRLHDLRHTHASQLLRANVHPKVVSERLGHAAIGITLDTYSHVLPGMQEEAAAKVDSVLRAAIGAHAARAKPESS